MLKKIMGLWKARGSAAAEAEASEAELSKIERASRVRLMPLHDVYFRPVGETGEPVVVANLSSSGLGLVRESGRFWPQPHVVVQGTLVLPQGQFQLQIKVVRNTPTIVGCAFVSGTPELFDAIQKYFQTELHALQLTQVRPEILKPEPDGTPRLFRSSRNCELFLVERDGALVRFQLSFLGHYFEGMPGQPLRYGFIHGDDKEKPKYKGSSIVRVSGNIPSEVIETAKKFILNVPDLSKQQRGAIEKFFAV